MPLGSTTLPVPPSSDREAETTLRGAMLRGTPVLVIPRRIYGGVAATLDDLSPEALPRLRFEGAVDDLQPPLRRAIAERLDGPRWLADWLVKDVVDQAETMAQFTGAPALRVRLDVIDDDHCRKFHVDDVHLRLLTTYRGPGTEWLQPRWTDRLASGRMPPPDAVRHLARGEIAILRGAKGATAERPGALHRSPAIAGTGVVRLLLVIDEIGRRLH